MRLYVCRFYDFTDSLNGRSDIGATFKSDDFDLQHSYFLVLAFSHSPARLLTTPADLEAGTFNISATPSGRTVCKIAASIPQPARTARDDQHSRPPLHRPQPPSARPPPAPRSSYLLPPRPTTAPNHPHGPPAPSRHPAPPVFLSRGRATARPKAGGRSLQGSVRRPVPCGAAMHVHCAAARSITGCMNGMLIQSWKRSKDDFIGVPPSLVVAVFLT